MPRATLSDLLADDIKDYFRREGVNDNLTNGGSKPSRQRRRRAPVDLPAENLNVQQQQQLQPPHLQQQRNSQPQQPTNIQHRRHLSSGSERNPHLTSQDAEFLKRYAEEKERASRALYKEKVVDVSSPRDLVHVNSNGTSNKSGNSKNFSNNIRTASSPRPPSVAGSHRPQLPSIDNDDWEEDDRLERKEWRRERRRKRSGLSADGHSRDIVGASHERRVSAGAYNGHQRKQSGVSHNGSVVYTNSWMNSSANSVGSGSFVRYPPSPQPWHPGHSPGDTLCYSASSQSQLPETFRRKESDDTFIRKESTEWHSHSMNGESNGKGHVRPLSYLSASSESESKSEEVNASLGPSPLSSGTFKTLPSESRYSLRSSDVSALWGGSILESFSPGSDKPQPFQKVDYKYNRKESSDEVSSGDESYSSSSVTSDSGYAKCTENDRLISRHKSYSSVPRKNRKRISPLRLDDALKVIWDKFRFLLQVLELYISNMPSLVGSLALAWSTLGVDWFKVRNT